MRSIFQWIKNHKIIVVLILVVAYFLTKGNNRIYPLSRQSILNSKSPQSFGKLDNNDNLSQSLSQDADIEYQPDYAPTSGIAQRMIVQNSSLSLLVDDVATIQNTIIQKTQELGGYMVNSSLTRPQDSPNATITLRVPTSNLNTALSFLRGVAIKVISENLEGEDVTDQYVDIDSRLATLVKTKLKFEAIMDQAVKVQDILEVQRELINLQSQIDALKGQQNYLEKNSQLAKITIYLSTDELALPYGPSESWRPQVIFKEAVRSLIGFSRKIGAALIWLVVYAMIWIPIGFIIFIWYKRKKKNPRAQLN